MSNSALLGLIQICSRVAMKQQQKKFTKNTFKYFEQAKKNKNSETWFEKNKEFYSSSVKEPMAFLIEQIKSEFGSELKNISCEPSRITKPTARKGRAEDGINKKQSHFTLWEKQTSLFEWNPAIHFQVGLEKDENLLGIGLYMVSSRQLSLLRANIADDYSSIQDILENKKLKKNWGSLQGEKYKRFPKGYSEDSIYADYLWHKQFFLSQHFTRTQVMSPDFSKHILKSLATSMDFFTWVRKTVGTYKK